VLIALPGPWAGPAADRKQAAWVNQLAAGLARADLDTAARVLGELSARLEAGLSQAHNKQGADHER
jgi:hypothetical protein